MVVYLPVDHSGVSFIQMLNHILPPPCDLQSRSQFEVQVPGSSEPILETSQRVGLETGCTLPDGLHMH